MQQTRESAQQGKVVGLTKDEITEIERLASVSDRAFVHVARLLAAAIRDTESLWLDGWPLTIGRLRAEIDAVFRGAQLRQPQGNLIAVGPEAAEPHHEGDDERRIRVGESVLVDLFPRSGNPSLPVFSDCSRTFCVGTETPSAKPVVRAARHVVKVKSKVESELARRLAVKGSAVGFDLQRLACEEFRQLGWDAQVGADGEVRTISEGYVHGLGHGVGREVHQHPTFSAEFAQQPEGLIQRDHVITIEPGLYVPGGFGVRYEDLLVIEGAADEAAMSARPRRLTRVPWALDPKEFLALVSRS